MFEYSTVLRVAASSAADPASRAAAATYESANGQMPGRSTRNFLTDKAVQSLRINQGPTVMWHAKPQTYSDSHCFVVKPQPT